MKTFFVPATKVKVVLDTIDTADYPEDNFFVFHLHETSYNIAPCNELVGEDYTEISKEDFEVFLSQHRDRTINRLSSEYTTVNLRENSKDYPYSLTIPYKEQDLTSLKALALETLQQKCRDTRETLAATKDSIKLVGYNAKVVIANAVLAGTANPYQIMALQSEIKLRNKNESNEDLARKIIKNSYEMSMLICMMDGIESGFSNAINNATTASEVATSLLGGQQELISTTKRILHGEQKPVVETYVVAGMPSLVDYQNSLKAKVAEEASNTEGQ